MAASIIIPLISNGKWNYIEKTNQILRNLAMYNLFNLTDIELKRLIEFFDGYYKVIDKTQSQAIYKQASKLVFCIDNFKKNKSDFNFNQFYKYMKLFHERFKNEFICGKCSNIRELLLEGNDE